jgi:hypothetical protein
MQPNLDQITLHTINTTGLGLNLCGYMSVANSIRFLNESLRYQLYRDLLLDDTEAQKLYEESITGNYGQIFTSQEISDMQRDYREATASGGNFLEKLDQAHYQIHRSPDNSITIIPSYYQKLMGIKIFQETRKFEHEVRKDLWTINYYDEMNYGTNVDIQALKLYCQKLNPKFELEYNQSRDQHIALIQQDLQAQNGKIRIFTHNNGNSNYGHYESIVTSRDIERYEQEIRQGRASSGYPEYRERSMGGASTGGASMGGVLGQFSELSIGSQVLPETVVPPPPPRIYKFHKPAEAENSNNKILFELISELLNSIKDSKIAENLSKDKKLYIDRYNFLVIENKNGEEQIFLKYEDPDSKVEKMSICINKPIFSDNIPDLNSCVNYLSDITTSFNRKYNTPARVQSPNTALRSESVGAFSGQGPTNFHGYV